MSDSALNTLPAVSGLTQEAGTIVCARELAEGLYAAGQAPAAHLSLYFLPVKSPDLSQVAYIKADNWRLWVDMYGADLCMHCLRQAYRWTLDNAARAKTAKGVHRFLGNWIAREAKHCVVRFGGRGGGKSYAHTQRQKQQQDRENVAAMALMAGEYLQHGNTGGDCPRLGHIGDDLPAIVKQGGTGGTGPGLA